MFLCDTSRPLEQALLESFVGQFEDPDTDSTPTFVHVSIERYHGPDDVALSEVLRSEDTTRLVPLRVAWLPDRGTEHSRPRLRDLVLGDARNPRVPAARYIQRQRPDRARCIAGEPATIAELRKRYEHQRAADWAGNDQDEPETFESFVLRQIGIALDVGERKLQGRRYKVPRLIIAGIEHSGRYRTSSRALAGRLGRTTAEVRGEARRYLEEMVATPSTFFIDWVGSLSGWITSLGYREVITDPENIHRARVMLRDHPSALLWTHKSHVDAIALLSVMYDADFPAPHSIAGMNMAFRGITHAGRRSGTVFIRRTFADNPIYKLALQQYLGFLMEKRFPLSWAFEGTRSRNGKLGPPRYGMLKYVVEAAHATETEDLHLIPVAINYDLIGETPDYAREESGEEKQAESLGWFLDYLRRLRSPMGNIYLDFADPVVLEGPAPHASAELLPAVAFEVARKVNQVAPVTLPSLMCLSLLGVAPRSLGDEEFRRSTKQLLDWLLERRIRLTRGLARSDLAELTPLAEQVFASGLVERFTEAGQTRYRISDDKASDASYYRNTIVHYFVNQAIGELALAAAAEGPAGQRRTTFEGEARWLRDLTKFEFFHTPSAEFLEAIDAELSRTDAAWDHALEGSSSEVTELLRRMRPLVSHATLLSVLEAYWLVARVAAQATTRTTLDRKEVVAAALRLGRAALREGEIGNRASVGKAMFTGAFSALADKGLVEPGEELLSLKRQDLVERLETTIRRVRMIAETANTDTPDGD